MQMTDSDFTLNDWRRRRRSLLHITNRPRMATLAYRHTQSGVI